MDRILLSTSRSNLHLLREQAAHYGFGLELQAFSEPEVLNGHMSEVLDQHERALAGFTGCIGIHGAFYDLTSASPDPAVTELTRRRYRQSLRAAAELKAEYVLFHLNYLGNCKIPNFRPGWLEREVEFWASFVLEAEQLGVQVALENTWEDEPSLITDILTQVNHPRLSACLDVAHATLYSQYPLESWIDALEPWLFCTHLNNHNGQLDLHWPLNQGIVDYPTALKVLRQSKASPYYCLEMSNWHDMERSLNSFRTPLSHDLQTELAC